MRALLLLFGCAVAAAPASAAAQARVRDPVPAFPAAISAMIGVTSFGDRQVLGGSTASYRSSLSFGVRGDLPLTRRLGLLGAVGVAPIATQRLDTESGTDLDKRVTSLRAEAALGWRFIPRAPVFFFGGGGIAYASSPAYPEFDESVVEPRALFGVGYDRQSAGPWNFRIVATGFVTSPATPDPLTWSGGGGPPPVQAKSSTFDYAIEVGGRYRLRLGR